MSGWLIAGAGGMLGDDLCGRLERDGEQVTGLTHDELDITNPAAATAVIARRKPSVVVNCAAWTAVGDARGPRIVCLATTPGPLPSLLQSATGDWHRTKRFLAWPRAGE